MKIECEKLDERDAAPELISELVRSPERRGEFMIMFDEGDDERFVQIACDYDDVGGKDDGRFDLEYRSGNGSALCHCTRRVSAGEVERIFLDELEGRGEWRKEYSWEEDSTYGNATPVFRFGDMSTLGKVVCVIGAVIGAAIGGIALVAHLSNAVPRVLRPEATRGDYLNLGIIVLFGVALFGVPLFQFVKWMRTRGTKRNPHERPVAPEGVKLRRMLPNGLLFLAIWCVGWNAGAFIGLLPLFLEALKAYSEKGFSSDLVVGVAFPLIGVGMTAYFLWLLWKHLRPCYEIRVSGGVLKEGGEATFEYRFKGDPEKVKSVVFATAGCASAETSNMLGAAPGYVNDEKCFSHRLQIASGSVSLRLTRVSSDFHARFRHYFRATVCFKSGLSVASSYRIPLD